MCDVCFCKIVEGYGQTECTTSGTMTNKADFTSGNFKFCSSPDAGKFIDQTRRPKIISCRKQNANRMGPYNFWPYNIHKRGGEVILKVVQE